MAREFIMPHRIITGAGALEAAAPELGRMGKKAMIVTGKVMAMVKKPLSPLVEKVCFGGVPAEAGR